MPCSYAELSLLSILQWHAPGDMDALRVQVATQAPDASAGGQSISLAACPAVFAAVRDDWAGLSDSSFSSWSSDGTAGQVSFPPWHGSTQSGPDVVKLRGYTGISAAHGSITTSGV